MVLNGISFLEALFVAGKLTVREEERCVYQ